MDAEGRELNLTQDGLTEVTWRKDDKRRKSGPPSARPRQKFQQQKSGNATENLPLYAVVVEDANSVSSELASWIKANAKNLKIRQKDRCWAAEMVNDFRENLLKFLRSNKDQPFFQSADFLNTGSYFEKVKIHSPDEFDMMLKLQAPSPLKMTALDSGVFYHIELMRPTRTPIEAFLLEDERTVSSSKILSEMYRLVRKFLKSYKERWDQHFSLFIYLRML
uniref:Mab-21-like nucleotidyltransferase domain-containing protein n=1 Tax=Monopterus albus TaxID=43700 RepID=A0A3Q3IYV9_MONAL